MMRKVEDDSCIFPLTSLQIGDLQSYLSDLSLFLANDSKKMYILVDNQPWLRDLGSRKAHLWQLMVTKSRLSPFANTKARRVRKEGKDIRSEPCTNKPKKFLRWFSLIDGVMLSRKRVLLPVKKLRNSLQLSSELHRTLYGFIVFEVAWTNVRGINYLNELQTDTSLAIETKFMQRWEFDSVAQAASCISSWFSGTLSDKLIMGEHLDSAAGEIFYDASENFSGTDDDDVCSIGVYSGNTEETTGIPHTPPPYGPYKRRKVMKSFSNGPDDDCYSEEMQGSIDNSLNYSETCTYLSEHTVEATQYSDVLILFRSNDRDLPFKLKEVIVSDLRLLTLLEAGLPSWVLFLQSYPGFCHLYRPWMCPLARLLYVLISIVTVLIGFYDLYKNVPVLKATASRLCGPLFRWIETWEMVSRVKCLGTILFLHNFQKAVKWFLAFTHTTRSFFSVLVQPLVEPLVEFFGFLLPTLNFLFQLVEDICSAIWLVIGTSCDLVGDLLELLFSPFWIIITVAWSVATSILCPIFWVLWEILYVPIRLVLGISSFVAFVYTCICNIIGNTWQFVSSIFQLASSSEATVSAYEVSMWRSLWNDLFSQIFRAVRSILNGFVAFFAACNRHRLRCSFGGKCFDQYIDTLHHTDVSLPGPKLSCVLIYNHLEEFIRKLYRRRQRSEQAELRYGRTCGAHNLAEDKGSKGRAHLETAHSLMK